MTFKTAESNKIAKMLAVHARDLHRDIGTTREAFFRAAINRAYYSCFNQAKALAFNDTPKLTRMHAADHAEIWEHLETTGSTTKQAIGGIGDRLRRARTIADYKPNRRVMEEEAKKAIEDADSILNLLSELDR